MCCVFLQYCSQQRHSTLWRRKSRDHRQKSVRKEERREAGKPEEEDDDEEEDSEGFGDYDLMDEESPDEKDVCSLDEKDEAKEETDVSSCINDMLFDILDPAPSSSSVFLFSLTHPVVRRALPPVGDQPGARADTNLLYYSERTRQGERAHTQAHRHTRTHTGTHTVYPFMHLSLSRLKVAPSVNRSGRMNLFSLMQSISDEDKGREQVNEAECCTNKWWRLFKKYRGDWC